MSQRELCPVCSARCNTSNTDNNTNTYPNHHKSISNLPNSTTYVGTILLFPMATVIYVIYSFTCARPMRQKQLETAGTVTWINKSEQNDLLVTTRADFPARLSRLYWSFTSTTWRGSENRQDFGEPGVRYKLLTAIVFRKWLVTINYQKLIFVLIIW